MRQSTREITDRTSLTAILDGCDVCRLGFCDNDRPYVVPVNFESLIGEGLIEIMTDTDEKRAGLDQIMAHVGRADCTYDDRVLARTCVLRLRVTQLSGKRLDK